MVQPVATSPSCISSYNPCELISSSCSAIGSLAAKIAAFIASIFTTIAGFVTSCVCGPSLAPPAPQPPAPIANAPIAPPAPPFLGETVTHIEGTLFLNDLITQMEPEYPDLKHRLAMSADAPKYLAMMIIERLAMRPMGRLDPLPYFVTLEMGNSGLTFADAGAQLRNDYAALSVNHRLLVWEKFIAMDNSTNDRWGQDYMREWQSQYYLAQPFRVLEQANRLLRNFIDFNPHFRLCAQDVSNAYLRSRGFL